MRLKVPITGTVLNEDPIEGDLDDPVRLINIDLGHVSWKLINIDLDNEEFEIEVTPSETICEEIEGLNERGLPNTKIRPTTLAERNQALANVNALIHGNSKEELFEISKSARLKRPSKSS